MQGLISPRQQYNEVPNRFCYHSKTQREGKSVSEFITAIKQCSKIRDLERGKTLHLDAVAAGYLSYKYVATALIRMYSKCGRMSLAREVFEDMVNKDVIAWTSFILGYVENGESSVAIDLFSIMDCEPDRFTYVSVFKACASLASQRESLKQTSLEKGVAIHEQFVNRGLHCDIVVANTLLDMYGKCGSMRLAREVFNGMIHKDVVSWTSLIMGYVENGESSMAMDLFRSMDCEANYVTYIAVLRACSFLASERVSDKHVFLKKGISLHRQLQEHGFYSHITVQNTLLDMYCKCGSISLAREVFDTMEYRTVVSWNSLLLGYVENGESSVAIDLFIRIDCEPDYLTYIAVLKACGSLGSGKESDKQVFLEKGIFLHRELKGLGLDSHTLVANTLMDMYGKCGSMERAQEVFDTLVRPNVVMWNCLILGYMENGENSVGLYLLTRMDCDPNCATYIAALKACTSVGTASVGQVVHSRICRLGLEEHQVVANALVDFYAKCNHTVSAEALLYSMHSPGIVSWTALIMSYTSLGKVSEVFSLVNKVQEGGLRMDGVMYMCLLTACSHSGMVEEGKKYFKHMQREGIPPTVEHYTCIIDMLGRANMLEDALSIVKGMPLEANAVTLTSLLGACRKWKNVEVGKVACDRLVCNNIRDGAAYSLMSDIYKALCTGID